MSVLFNRFVGQYLTRVLILALVVILTAGQDCRGQSVQATKYNFRTTKVYSSTQMLQIEKVVIKQFAFLSLIDAHIDNNDDSPLKTYSTQVKQLISMSVELLRITGHPRKYTITYSDYSEKWQRFIESISAIVGDNKKNKLLTDQGFDIEQFNSLKAELKILSLPNLPMQVLYEGVVFTVGDVVDFGNSDTFDDPINSIVVSTSLLGDAVGTAFNVLGSETLEKYFQNNLSVATSIPTGGKTRLTADIGLGLGEIDLKFLKVYLVLGLSQMDSADVRVPRDLVNRFVEQDNWSAPNISIGFFIGDALKTKRKLPPAAILLGIRLPHYYPGSALEALPALFTADRSKFEPSGKATFSIGIAFPLDQIKSRK